MNTKLKQKSQSSDMNAGTLPFKITIPITIYALEFGRKVVKFTMGMYHLVGFTKGKGHVKLLQIQKDLPGDNDPDILPDLYINGAANKVEEYKEIAKAKVDKIYWTQNSLTVAK